MTLQPEHVPSAIFVCQDTLVCVCMCVCSRLDADAVSSVIALCVSAGWCVLLLLPLRHAEEFNVCVCVCHWFVWALFSLCVHGGHAREG